MNATLQEAEITPEEFLKVPDAGRFELVDGRLVERHMGPSRAS
jgi:hypothetical protein